MSSKVPEGDAAKVNVQGAERLQADEIFVGSTDMADEAPRPEFGGAEGRPSFRCSVHMVRPARQTGVVAA